MYFPDRHWELVGSSAMVPNVPASCVIISSSGTWDVPFEIRLIEIVTDFLLADCLSPSWLACFDDGGKPLWCGAVGGLLWLRRVSAYSQQNSEDLIPITTRK